VAGVRFGDGEYLLAVDVEAGRRRGAEAGLDDAVPIEQRELPFPLDFGSLKLGL
jgi:hypothetical protein